MSPTIYKFRFRCGDSDVAVCNQDRRRRFMHERRRLMHKNVTLLCAAACSAALLLGTGLRAHAQGVYTGVEGAATLFNEGKTRVVPQPLPTIRAHTNFDVGWLAGANAGYEWPLGFALEEEFAFRQND